MCAVYFLGKVSIYKDATLCQKYIAVHTILETGTCIDEQLCIFDFPIDYQVVLSENKEANIY
jgi:hypothetical protein